jgi:ABC-type transport system involved in multi-copper enzyme maturation permease subunit
MSGLGPARRKPSTWAVLQEALTLPLLTKELAEQSSRWQTFALRTLFALLIYSTALPTLWGTFNVPQSNAMSLLGRGKGLFDQVVIAQLIAIYVLTPCLVAGVVTSEKERDTLAILLITRLSPTKIVFEKFLGRVVPVLQYLLLPLPLLGVAYSIGGVEYVDLFWATVAMMAAVLQLGSLAVFCSCYCRTTAQALCLTYLIWGLAYAVTRVVLNVPITPWPYQFTDEFINGRQIIILVDPLLLATSPWLLLVREATVVGTSAVLALVLPVLFWLSLSRWSLWPRAFLKPQYRLLKFFRWLDELFHRMNDNRVTKGIVLIRDSAQLPIDRPIAWRETSKKSFGTARYLIRLMVVMLSPLLFLLLAVDPNAGARSPSWIVIEVIVWCTALFLVVTHGSSLFMGERSRQTLDVLLSLPLTSQDIVDQKFAGLQRLVRVLRLPLLVVYTYFLWWDWERTRGQFGASGSGAVLADRLSLSQLLAWFEQGGIGSVLMGYGLQLLAIWVYLPLLAWISVHASLRYRSHLTAILTLPILVLAMVWLRELLITWLQPARVAENELLLTFLVELLLPAPSRMVELPLGGLSQMNQATQLPNAFVATAVAHFFAYWLLTRWLRSHAADLLDRSTLRCPAAEDAKPAASTTMGWPGQTDAPPPASAAVAT